MKRQISEVWVKAYLEVEDVPIQQLVDLWAIKYGSDWVDGTDMEYFYAATAQRLTYMGKIEKIITPTNWNAKYRLIEE